ncbi:hypothetical protein BH23BAC2_BH23BAC2_23810 [soil metagenome]
MEIIWTQMARVTYFEILENLGNYWTSKEFHNFQQLTDENLSQITSGKTIHPIVFAKIRRVIIHPNVALFYKIDAVENRLFLITFFNNRMNPNLIKKLLKLYVHIFKNISLKCSTDY